MVTQPIINTDPNKYGAVSDADLEAFTQYYETSLNRTMRHIVEANGVTFALGHFNKQPPPKAPDSKTVLFDLDFKEPYYTKGVALYDIMLAAFADKLQGVVDWTTIKNEMRPRMQGDLYAGWHGAHGAMLNAAKTIQNGTGTLFGIQCRETAAALDIIKKAVDATIAAAPENVATTIRLPTQGISTPGTSFTITDDMIREARSASAGTPPAARPEPANPTPPTPLQFTPFRLRGPRMATSESIIITPTDVVAFDEAVPAIDTFKSTRYALAIIDPEDLISKDAFHQKIAQERQRFIDNKIIVPIMKDRLVDAMQEFDKLEANLDAKYAQALAVAQAMPPVPAAQKAALDDAIRKFRAEYDKWTEDTRTVSEHANMIFAPRPANDMGKFTRKYETELNNVYEFRDDAVTEPNVPNLMRVFSLASSLQYSHRLSHIDDARKEVQDKHEAIASRWGKGLMHRNFRFTEVLAYASTHQAEARQFLPKTYAAVKAMEDLIRDDAQAVRNGEFRNELNFGGTSPKIITSAEHLGRVSAEDKDKLQRVYDQIPENYRLLAEHHNGGIALGYKVDHHDLPLKALKITPVFLQSENDVAILAVTLLRNVFPGPVEIDWKSVCDEYRGSPHAHAWLKKKSDKLIISSLLNAAYIDPSVSQLKQFPKARDACRAYFAAANQQAEVIRQQIKTERLEKYKPDDKEFAVNTEPGVLTPAQREYFTLLNEVIQELGVSPQQFEEQFNKSIFYQLDYLSTKTLRAFGERLENNLGANYAPNPTAALQVAFTQAEQFGMLNPTLSGVVTPAAVNKKPNYNGEIIPRLGMVMADYLPLFQQRGYDFLAQCPADSRTDILNNSAWLKINAGPLRQRMELLPQTPPQTNFFHSLASGALPFSATLPSDPLSIDIPFYKAEMPSLLQVVGFSAVSALADFARKKAVGPTDPLAQKIVKLQELFLEVAKAAPITAVPAAPSTPTNITRSDDDPPEVDETPKAYVPTSISYARIVRAANKEVNQHTTAEQKSAIQQMKSLEKQLVPLTKLENLNANNPAHKALAEAIFSDSVLYRMEAIFQPNGADVPAQTQQNRDLITAALRNVFAPDEDTQAWNADHPKEADRNARLVALLPQHPTLIIGLLGDDAQVKEMRELKKLLLDDLPNSNAKINANRRLRDVTTALLNAAGAALPTPKPDVAVLTEDGQLVVTESTYQPLDGLHSFTRDQAASLDADTLALTLLDVNQALDAPMRQARLNRQSARIKQLDTTRKTLESLFDAPDAQARLLTRMNEGFAGTASHVAIALDTLLQPAASTTPPEVTTAPSGPDEVVAGVAAVAAAGAITTPPAGGTPNPPAPPGSTPPSGGAMPDPRDPQDVIDSVTDFVRTSINSDPPLTMFRIQLNPNHEIGNPLVVAMSRYDRSRTPIRVDSDSRTFQLNQPDLVAATDLFERVRSHVINNVPGVTPYRHISQGQVVVGDDDVIPTTGILNHQTVGSQHHQGKVVRRHGVYKLHLEYHEPTGDIAFDIPLGLRQTTTNFTEARKRADDAIKHINDEHAVHHTPTRGDVAGWLQQQNARWENTETLDLAGVSTHVIVGYPRDASASQKTELFVGEPTRAGGVTEFWTIPIEIHVNGNCVRTQYLNPHALDADITRARIQQTLDNVKAALESRDLSSRWALDAPDTLSTFSDAATVSTNIDKREFEKIFTHAERLSSDDTSPRFIMCHEAAIIRKQPSADGKIKLTFGARRHNGARSLDEWFQEMRQGNTAPQCVERSVEIAPGATPLETDRNVDRFARMVDTNFQQYLYSNYATHTNAQYESDGIPKPSTPKEFNVLTIPNLLQSAIKTAIQREPELGAAPDQSDWRVRGGAPAAGGGSTSPNYHNQPDFNVYAAEDAAFIAPSKITKAVRPLQ